jgi:hypothetical protein
LAADLPGCAAFLAMFVSLLDKFGQVLYVRVNSISVRLFAGNSPWQEFRPLYWGNS